MIIVIEGLSASGKTTWCQRHYPEITIPESSPLPDLVTRPERVDARQELNDSRWGRAIEMEERRGIAVCDSDPLSRPVEIGPPSRRLKTDPSVERP
jgi:hypothetical protein